MIECTGMADPGPIIQTFFSHDVLCERYLLDGVIALVDAVHANEQMNQFTIAQSQIGYADRILLTKTDVAGDSEKLRERLARINARAPVYTVVHGDIDLSQLFNTSGFMLEENVLASQPRFHFIADKQNDVSSIVVELDYPVDISEVSRVMENLLLESADKLLRYKGMLWIDGEPNRLLFRAASLQRRLGQTVGRRNAAQHAGIYRDPVAGRRDQSGVCGVKEVNGRRKAGTAQEIVCPLSEIYTNASGVCHNCRGWSYVPPVKAVRPISATATRNCRWAQSSPEKPAASVTGKSICYAPAS